MRRAREALFERLPVWVRLRCGLEARTLLALGAVLAAAGAIAVHHFLTGRPHTVAIPPLSGPGALAAHVRPGTAPGPSGADDDDELSDAAAAGSGPAAPLPAAAGSSPGLVVVDVAGKVRSPGVLRLPSGSRVADALKAAGGALPGVDTSPLNLARPLADGEQVLVGRPPQDAPPPAGVGSAAPGPVSLSGATAEQLDVLPGVGPVLARHIVEWRQRHGGVFTTVGQLRQVPGVGDRRYDELRALVRP